MKTVIITGAGASKELDVFTGKELLSEILKNMGESDHFPEGNDLLNQFFAREKSKANGVLYDNRKAQIYSKNIFGFKENLSKWNESNRSIDEFLQDPSNEEFREFGQFAISYYITGKEEWLMRQNIYGIKLNWLRLFLENHLEPNIDRIRNGKVDLKFITFNYERTIEHFTYNYLRHKSNPIPGLERDKDEAKNFIDLFKIQHVYGKIANLDWESRNDTNAYQFGERNNDLQFTSRAMNNIKLIGQRIEKSKQEAIRRVMQEADRIYLLGFGFDQTNMEVLFGENLEILNQNSTKIFATAYQNADTIKRKFPMINVFNGKCFELVKDSNIFYLN